MIGQDISQFARMAPLDDESEYARSGFFGGHQKVYTQRLGEYLMQWELLGLRPSPHLLSSSR